ISDLSWLNPTPHAIAVYASQPTSPLTTQHSLPSRRYSLLGPDLHRLDRTSFAWRTHSITSSVPAMSDGGTSRPRALAVLRLIARCKGYTKIEPTLGEALMTKTLTALMAAATLASATSAVPTTAQERCVGCGIGGPEYPI